MLTNHPESEEPAHISATNRDGWPSITRYFLLLRPWDWHKTKLRFHLFAALFLQPTLPFSDLFAFLCTVIAWASFGYGINEISDRDTDVASYKQNRALELDNFGIVSFITVSVLATLLLANVWAQHWSTVLLVACGLLLSACYSFHPIRLKERGVWGILTGAAAQWTFPVIVIGVASENLEPVLPIWLLAILAQTVGIRWMCVHQLQDKENDYLAGVETLATAGIAIEKVIYLVFSLECLVLASLLYLTLPQSHPALFAAAIWGLYALTIKRPVLNIKERLCTFSDAPLAGYYFIALPMSYVVVALASHRIWLDSLISALVNVRGFF